MKKLLFLGIIILLPLVFAKLPTPENQYVNDYAFILEDSQIVYLQELFRLVEENTTAQMVFVSVQTTQDLTPAEYATQIGQEWGVGQEETDNGLVILYVQDVHTIWVAPGYGLEGILPDSKIGRLLDEYYVPQRDTGELSKGILDVSTAFAQEIVENPESMPARSRPNPLFSIIILVIIILLLVLVVRIAMKHRTSFIPVFIPSGGYHYSGHSPSFGGGSFGGGGAGR